MLVIKNHRKKTVKNNLCTGCCNNTETGFNCESCNIEFIDTHLLIIF